MELFIVQYGHIWYQNDGNKISNRMMRSNLKKCLDLNFWQIFFIIFTYIFGHRDLDLWPKVTKFNRVRAKQPFSENRVQIGASVRLEFCSQEFRTHRQTDRHAHTQTNWSENITPPRFRGGVKSLPIDLNFFGHETSNNHFFFFFCLNKEFSKS